MTPVARRSADAAAQLRGTAPVALDFLHTVLTQTGLPYRNPGDAVRAWERRQGAALLSIEAGKVADPCTHDFLPVGLPFGEKARLVLIHLTGEALRSRSPVIEVGDTLTAYVRELGLGTDGRTIGTVKDQLTRLSAATVRLAYFEDGHAAQVNSQLVSGLDLWAPLDAHHRTPWPSTVQLSADFFASIQRQAVPLARPAIRALGHSALGLDLYCWLAQRLHRVSPGKPQAVSWEALKAQFGAGYAREVDFRRKFKAALRGVLTVYPDAKIEEVAGGLLLHRSRPPIAPRMVAAGLSKPGP